MLSSPRSGKTMGRFALDTSFPHDSVIYWHGQRICTTRILEQHKKGNSIKDAPKVKCFLVAKLDHWVHYLGKRANATVINVLTRFDKERLVTVKLSQTNTKERIATRITTLRDSWAQRKKYAKYSIQQNYFGQCVLFVFQVFPYTVQQYLS